MTAEQQYDAMHNEGGDGYNPHRAAREEQERRNAAAQAMTREGRRESIRRQIERLDCAIARESGTYCQAEIDSLRAQLAAIDAEARAEIVAAWPLGVTVARRADWNARVRSGEFSGRDGRPDLRLVARAEAAQGWTRDDLRRAVAAHNL